VRTCMLAELDQTGESQISLTDPDSRAMAAHTILRRRFDPPRVQQSYAAGRFSRMTTLDKRRQIQAQPEPPGRRSAAKHLDARRPRRPGFGSGSGADAQPRAGPVSLTPGSFVWADRQKVMSAEELVEVLYRRSGVLGLSGISSDFREILASDEPRARFAVEVFCYRVAGHIASLAAPLGGLDGIVFTAGVGENAVPVRSAICRECSWLGLELDEAANREHRERISTPNSRVAAYVIKNRREPDDRATRPCAGRKLNG
jgi:hypothetical protein